MPCRRRQHQPSWVVAFSYQEFAPPTRLDLIVRRSFFAKGRIAYRSDKILPTGLIPVLFNAGRPHRLGKSPSAADNPSFAHSWIDGFQTTPTYNTPTDGTHVLGILFEPIGFHALFGTDMPTIRDRTVAGRDLLPAPFITEVEAMLLAASDAATHDTLFTLLSTMPRRPLPAWLWSVYREIRNSRGAVVLAGCYRRHGVSGRHATASMRTVAPWPPPEIGRAHV